MSESMTFQDTMDRLKLCVTDDAKKSVSFRMHTSEYGRLRVLAEKLKARDSVVFRFLLRVALEQCRPLYDNNANACDRLRLLAELGPEFATFFNFDTSRLEETFLPETLEPRIKIEEDDLGLIAAFGTSRELVRKRLEKLLNVEHVGDDLHAVLHDYLIEKYLTNGSDACTKTVVEATSRV
jgi:hypothetical protein